MNQISKKHTPTVPAQPATETALIERNAIENFAVDLAIARAFWRKHRSLVEGRQLPPVLRPVFAEMAGADTSCPPSIASHLASTRDRVKRGRS